MNHFGLIGYPLTHSFSKKYFDQKFIEKHIHDASFSLWELENINQLPELIKSTVGIKGICITIPYKKKVLEYLDESDDAVKAIGACNCIKIKNDKLFGYNTDILGFKLSFMNNLQPNHKKALVLGSGGASAGIEYVLKELNIEYLIVSRQNLSNNINYTDISDEMINDYQIIINCTPLGTYPNIDTCPPLPYDTMTSSNYLFDLVYNPEETLFLKKGKEKGAIIQNGYDMLVHQAEENWRIWNS